jgi:hypothetical protein
MQMKILATRFLGFLKLFKILMKSSKKT